MNVIAMLPHYDGFSSPRSPRRGAGECALPLSLLKTPITGATGLRPAVDTASRSPLDALIACAAFQANAPELLPRRSADELSSRRATSGRTRNSWLQATLVR